MGELIDLSGRQPAWPRPAVELWAEGRRRVDDNPRSWDTPPRLGHPALREQLADVLGSAPGRVAVTGGVRHAVLVVARRTSEVVIESPTFAGVPRLFEELGTVVRLASWEEMATAPSARSVLWVTSPGRNPDGRTVGDTLVRRLAAGRALVVQNEVYRWYSAIPERIPDAATVGSLSKLAGGGARIGWIDGEELLEAAAPVLAGARPPGPWQLAWARFLEGGGLGLLREAVVEPALAAVRTFAAVVEPVLGAIERDDGPFVLLSIPSSARSLTEERAAADLLAIGVRAGLGRDFLTPVPSLRLCFTGVSAEMAASAAERVAEVAARWRAAAVRREPA
jgi:DNA-binding transcriptional MocR family regulator